MLNNNMSKFLAFLVFGPFLSAAALLAQESKPQGPVSTYKLV